MTIAEFTRLAERELLSLYPAEAEVRAMTRILLQHYGAFTSAQIHAFPELSLNDTALPELTKAVQELSTGKPLQYVMGETVFCDLRFEVNEQVLIPRPETEELVRWAADEIKKNQTAAIIDLCTGSGCIAVALAKQFPHAHIAACDLSLGAMEVARRNAKRNQVQVDFFECDILTTDHLSHLTTPFSYLISNPPYVRLSEKAAMHKNVLEFEPPAALFVEDADPLIFYRAIATIAQAYLLPEGSIFVEINEALGNETKQLFINFGFAQTALRKDIHGKDRLLKAKR